MAGCHCTAYSHSFHQVFCSTRTAASGSSSSSSSSVVWSVTGRPDDFTVVAVVVLSVVLLGCKSWCEVFSFVTAAPWSFSSSSSFSLRVATDAVVASLTAVVVVVEGVFSFFFFIFSFFRLDDVVVGMEVPSFRSPSSPGRGAPSSSSGCGAPLGFPRRNRAAAVTPSRTSNDKKIPTGSDGAPNKSRCTIRDDVHFIVRCFFCVVFFFS